MYIFELVVREERNSLFGGGWRVLVNLGKGKKKILGRGDIGNKVYWE